VIPAIVTFVLGAALTVVAVRLNAFSWACHAYASALGGQWFVSRTRCPGCSRRVHVFRADPVGGQLCTRCSSGSAR
jgi:hypothetical protein